MTSYAEYLGPFLPHLPPDLISRDCLDRILSVTADLPASLGVGPFMIECGLAGEPSADFSVAALASRGDPAALFRIEPAHGTSRHPDGDGWSRIRAFARWWSDASGPLNRAIEEVWLEYDVCLTRGRSDTPNVFFRLEFPTPACDVPGDYLLSASHALHVLQGDRPSPSLLAMLAECLGTLPAGARILFLGAMIPRGPGTLRVVVSDMKLVDILCYLDRLGSPRPGQPDLLADIEGRTDHLWLAIDVHGHGVRPRIGFDCYLDAAGTMSGGAAWTDVLNVLIEYGACSEPKRAALARAIDLTNHTLDDRVWPASIRRISEVLGPAGLNRLDLYLHHLKVIDRLGEPLEAKAYLCGRYR